MCRPVAGLCGRTHHVRHFVQRRCRLSRLTGLQLVGILFSLIWGGHGGSVQCQSQTTICWVSETSRGSQLRRPKHAGSPPQQAPFFQANRANAPPAGPLK